MEGRPGAVYRRKDYCRKNYRRKGYRRKEAAGASGMAFVISTLHGGPGSSDEPGAGRVGHGRGEAVQDRT